MGSGSSAPKITRIRGRTARQAPGAATSPLLAGLRRPWSSPCPALGPQLARGWREGCPRQRRGPPAEGAGELVRAHGPGPLSPIQDPEPPRESGHVCVSPSGPAAQPPGRRGRRPAPPSPSALCHPASQFLCVSASVLLAPCPSVRVPPSLSLFLLHLPLSLNSPSHLLCLPSGKVTAG